MPRATREADQSLCPTDKEVSGGDKRSLSACVQQLAAQDLIREDNHCGKLWTDSMAKLLSYDSYSAISSCPAMNWHMSSFLSNSSSLDESGVLH